MEQVETLTILDSKVYVGYFSENLNNNFVICSDSIMQGGVSLGILYKDTKAEYRLPTSSVLNETAHPEGQFKTRRYVASPSHINSRPNIQTSLASIAVS